MMPVMLEATGLSYRVKGRQIVQDVNLSLRQNETLGLIGPNGSGKSTLLRVLTGLLRPDHGAVRLQGIALHEVSRRDIARRLAFVAQSQEASERMTVHDAIALGRTPWLSALSPWSRADEAAVQRALADVGLAGFDRREWDSLSGGERQRAHIARALAQKPALLVLDEPANHLDIHHQLSVLDLIDRLSITTIMALHDLNHALRCDRLICLQGGRIVASGAPAEVLQPALLRAVFNVEAQLLLDPISGKTVLHFTSISRN